MGAGRPVWRDARTRIQGLLAAGNDTLNKEEVKSKCFFPVDKASALSINDEVSLALSMADRSSWSCLP